MKFEDANAALDYVKLNAYMFDFDMKSGYHHISIVEFQQTFLGFAWPYNGKQRYFVFKVLPFGLSSAGYIFSKVVRGLVKHWRSLSIPIVVYLDDGFATHENYHTCCEFSKRVRIDLFRSGFVENKSKSNWQPVQCLEWLGIVWNLKLGELSYSDKKLDSLEKKVHSVLQNPKNVSARVIAKVTGKIISMSLVFGNITRLMTRHLHHLIIDRITWDSILNLTKWPEAIAELNFWIQNCHKYNCKKLCKNALPEIMGFSDASKLACGAYLVQCNEGISHKMWTEDESKKSSTWRELKALSVALLSFSTFLKRKRVTWYTDNQNVGRIIDSGSMKPDLHNIALEIFNWSVQNDVSLDVQWVPRNQNEKADSISRIIDYDDWEVTDQFFDFMSQKWGPYDFDRFASFENTKCKQFNSKFWNPGTRGVNAFSFDWKGYNNWLVPPVCLVIKVINHLVSCRANGTLIVPKWPSAVFWPVLFEKWSKHEYFLADILDIKNSDTIFKHGKNKKSIFGSDKFYSNVLAVKFQF